MNVETAGFYASVIRQINRRFKKRIFYYVVCDLLLLVFSVALLFFDFFSGIVLSVLLVPRMAIACCVAFSRTSVLPLYTKITFHRESILKRLATMSHHIPLFAWATYSYFGAGIIFLSAIIIGVAHIVVEFGTVGFVAGVVSVTGEIFMLVVAWWFLASARNIYHYAVTQNIDSLLDSKAELRKAFVIASAAVHNERVNAQFTKKSNSFLDRRRLGLGLGLDSQGARSHNAPNRKNQR